MICLEQSVKTDVSSREALSQRVRRTLEDLAVIQQSLGSHPEQIDGDAAEPSPLLDLELAAELKSVVDALRRLLWAYIEALSAKSGRQPHEVLEWYKMQLAVDMLRAARPNLPAATAESTEFYTFQDLMSGALAITSSYAGQERRC
jgi:hypothetical protein